MERSEEIHRLVARWMAAIADGDAASSLGRLSEHPGTLAIGTDVAEWWRGPAARRVWRRQIDELGAFPIDCQEIEAWEEGTVGWASVRFTFIWAGRVQDARATCVLHLEHGEWRCVQLHWSHPSANETIGMELTRTLEELERIVERDRPDLSGSRAADGTVTIAFTDIVDSTRLLSGLGDEAWLGILRTHNVLITDVTSAHGGRVVETHGDGSMLAFSSARRAVTCARSIQQRIRVVFAGASTPIRVRIGMHTGDALYDADHFYGTTVHYAARVAGHARAGEVLVSGLVRDLTEAHGVRYVDDREVELKGLPGTHRVFSVAVE